MQHAQLPARARHPLVYLCDYALVNTINNLPIEPKTLKSALKDSHWFATMKYEHQTLHDNDTWEPVSRPPNANNVGLKWVYRIKYQENGSIGRFKDQLVEKGFSQVYGVDYAKTFSLMA